MIPAIRAQFSKEGQSVPALLAHRRAASMIARSDAPTVAGEFEERAFKPRRGPQELLNDCITNRGCLHGGASEAVDQLGTKAL